MGRISDALRRLYGDGEGENKQEKLGKSKFNKKEITESSLDNTKTAGIVYSQSTNVDPSVVYPKVFFGEVSHKIFMYYQSSIALMEEMRHIASTVVGLEEKVFLVTSAQPGEGKTIVSLNLAMAIASVVDKKVLYVDADMRALSSSLSFLDLPEKKLSGFTDVLFGDADLSSAIVGTEVDGFFIMPRGQKRSLDRVGYEKINRFMSSVREQFDVVLIDASPVRMFSDPRLLTEIVDAVLLIVRMNETPRGSVKHAVQLLKDAKAKKIYFILNAVMKYMPGKNVDSKYYSYYAKRR